MYVWECSRVAVVGYDGRKWEVGPVFPFSGVKCQDFSILSPAETGERVTKQPILATKKPLPEI